jgi:hypothetical protein
MRESGFGGLLVAAMLLSLAGCADPFAEDEWRRRIGVIDVGGSQPGTLQLPDTVAIATTFTVTVRTYGSSTCTRADGARVEVEGLVAEITPYDRVLEEGVCTDDLAPFPRVVALRFDEPGEALVRVVGRSISGFGAEIERSLFVRP